MQNIQGDENPNPTEEAYYPTAESYQQDSPYGLCTEFTINEEVRLFSYDEANQCHVECGKGEQRQCFDIWDECIDWADNSNECINFERMAFPKAAEEGCIHWVPEDPTFECYEWE